MPGASLPNTRLEYVYRDGSNSKSWGSVVFGGAMTDDLRRRLLAALEGGEFLIADQIRLPEVFPESWPQYADDHCWHAFVDVELTNDAPDDEHGLSIAIFVCEVERAAVDGWRVFDPLDRRNHLGFLSTNKASSRGAAASK